MPKATFFNLPEGKRIALIEACQIEFSRVPLYEASIANIVKTAQIARGSFYQYFEDKEDAYFYVLRKQISKRHNQFFDYLKEKEGNLFEALSHFYSRLLIDIPNEEEFDFFRNALLNVTHHTETIFNEMIEGQGRTDDIEQIKDHIDASMLNIDVEKELTHLIQIITAVAFRNFVERFRDNLSNEVAIEKFEIEMNILKNGLAK